MKLLPPPCSSRVWQKQAEKKPGSRHPWDGEVHDEEVGDAVQLLALDHGDADQDVAGDAAREDDRVENAEYDLTVVRSLARAGGHGAGHRIRSVWSMRATYKTPRFIDIEISSHLLVNRNQF